MVSSFRVLERNEPVGIKSFDGNRGVARPISTVRPYSQVDFLAEEENMFAGLKGNRYVDSPCAVHSSPFVVWRVRKSALGPVPRGIFTLSLRPPSTPRRHCFWHSCHIIQGCLTSGTPPQS